VAACRGSKIWAVVILASAAVAHITPAEAHGAERGFVLLLPTGYYLFGGAAAVAASFLLLCFVPPRIVDRLARARWPLGTMPAISPAPTSLAAFLLLCLLIAAGLFGSRDPLANPLPLMIWTVWWVAITLLHAVFGNLWALINPWIGAYTLLDRLAGGGSAAPGCWPIQLGSAIGQQFCSF